MSGHMRKHSGYATQARRRGEDMVLCNSCGRHPRGYAAPEPIITGWRDVASILGQAAAFLVILGGIVGGLYLWALAGVPA